MATKPPMVEVKWRLPEMPADPSQPAEIGYINVMGVKQVFTLRKQRRGWYIEVDGNTAHDDPFKSAVEAFHGATESLHLALPLATKELTRRFAREIGYREV